MITTLLFMSMPKLSIILIAGALYLYFDFKYCTHADFRNGLIVEGVIFWYTKIFYNVTYIRKKNAYECGYYLTKRVWLWLLFMPIAIIIRICKHFIWEIFDYVENLFYYNNHCIVDNEKMLTTKDKNNIIKQLIK